MSSSASDSASASEFRAESSLVAEVVPSPNHGERKNGRQPDMIVLHYTGMPSAEMALDRLSSAGSEVSSHYLIFVDGRIVQLVPEGRRAWHAGTGTWAGEDDINSCSIGIEIVNPGHDFGYPDFPRRQIAAVTALCRSIQTRHDIAPVRIVAHSDIAPARKQDPGEKFPWRTLHDSGVGCWVKPVRIRDGGAVISLGDRGDAVLAIQESLADYGYGIANNGNFDTTMQHVVEAFQRHFRPARIDGVCDESTLATLRDLLAARDRPRTIAARARRIEVNAAP